MRKPTGNQSSNCGQGRRAHASIDDDECMDDVLILWAESVRTRLTTLIISLLVIRNGRDMMSRCLAEINLSRLLVGNRSKFPHCAVSFDPLNSRQFNRYVSSKEFKKLAINQYTPKLTIDSNISAFVLPTVIPVVAESELSSSWKYFLGDVLKRCNNSIDPNKIKPILMYMLCLIDLNK